MELMKTVRTVKSYRRHFGLTLINLLVSLLMVSMLMVSGIPAITQTYHQQRANSAYNNLFTLVQFTRLQAVNYHSQVILCPTKDNINCISDWRQQLMIFVDKDNDEAKSSREQLLRVRAPLRADEVIKWNASGSRRYLRFKGDGSTANQNGRLSYCLRASNKLYAKQIVMFFSGRARRGSKNSAIEKCNANN